ncbi:MAG: hypothetical protein AB7I30_04430 [Isosphaeraceae bacterium]
MTTPARVAANRRNALKSTGPKTAEGKARSSRNALSHGLTAATLVVGSVEDVEAYQARLDAWNDDAKPVGPIERALVARACHASWRLERAARQEAATLRHDARAAADAHDQARLAEAVQLGERLIRDPLNRCAIPRMLNRDFAAKVEAWRQDDPAVLAFELERTAEGVDWKLARWEELALMLRREEFWHYDARYKALKLIGKRPEDVMFDPVVERVTLACVALHPEAWDLWDDCFQATLATEGRPVYRIRVDRMRARQSPDKGAALAELWALHDTEVARLQALKADRLDARAAADRDEAAERALLDQTPLASLRIRYEAAAERALHRALGDFAKLRGARPERDEEPTTSPEVEVETRTEPEIEVTPEPGPRGAAPRRRPGPADRPRRNEPKPPRPPATPTPRRSPRNAPGGAG